MIFPLEVTASGEKFVSCIVSSEEYYCLNFTIYCVFWCYFYTVKQQPCRRINNLIIKYSTFLKKKNIGRTLSDINHSNIFLNSPPRVMKINTKINKWDLVKLKSFCTANYKQNIKTTYRMRENICNLYH